MGKDDKKGDYTNGQLNEEKVLLQDLKLGSVLINTISDMPNGTSALADKYLNVPPRDQWTHKMDFIMSCVGYAVGLGNVWRFPYLCFKNGGGAFLIPYAICMLTAGVPVFFLEIALGQFMSEGTVTVWRLVPIFKGIGYGTVVIVTLLNVYYIIIMAWALYYLFMSFTTELPWGRCDNPWNTPRCSIAFQDSDNSSTNVTSNNVTKVDAVIEFWERKILEISGGVDEVGNISWQLAVCLLLVWIICYFIIWKGVKSSGRAVYFTAVFPYVMLAILLFRGITLPGAIDGIIFYLKPDFTRLTDAEVWIDAGTQIFFSYAIATSALIALGSYNEFHNDCYKDSIIICLINSLTSLFAGFVIFPILGFMAYEQGVPVNKVAASGPGLAFIAYPKAVTKMPVAPLWSILFFIMVILLGIDSQFVGVEGFITAVVDMFPAILRVGYRKEVFIAVTCLFSWLIGLTMVTNGGMYVFQLFDYYSASGMTLLWFCIFECIAISWVYGGKRFYSDIEMMIGYRLNPWLNICWTVIAPLVCAGIFLFSLVSYKPITYDDRYTYPIWADAIGWVMGLASMVCIPGYMCYKLWVTSGTFAEKWKILTTPDFKPHHLKRMGLLGKDDFHQGVAPVYECVSGL